MGNKDHDINNMGDFLQCKKSDCIWGATWSMGHICDYCRLAKCICPCPLTKEWLEKNKYEIGLKRLNEILTQDKKGIEFSREKGITSEVFKDTNKSKWTDNGKLELIERLYTYVPQLKELRDKK